MELVDGGKKQRTEERERRIRECVETAGHVRFPTVTASRARGEEGKSSCAVFIEDVFKMKVKTGLICSNHSTDPCEKHAATSFNEVNLRFQQSDFQI